jgi:AcrR family transcriptional regulator
MAYDGHKLDKIMRLPSQEWLAYVMSKEPEDASIQDVCKKAGVARSTYYSWTDKDPKFKEWLDERVAYYRQPIHTKLEQIALANLQDYKFWEAMAKRSAFITDKPQGDKPVEDLFPPMTKDQAEELLKKRTGGEK